MIHDLSGGLRNALGAAVLLVGCGGQSPTQPSKSSVIRFATITVGRFSTCGVTTTGAAYCWGSDDGGQLGDNDSTGTACGFPCRMTPTPVAGGLRFSSVSAGGSFACGVATGGAAYCWGADMEGELGAGTTGLDACPILVNSSYPCSRKPIAVAGGLTFTTISAGTTHACGLTGNGAAYCWGDAFYGALGDSSTTGPDQCSIPGGSVIPCSTKPVAVAGGLSFVAIDAGTYHTCAITHAGVAYCWGGNSAGQLGDDTTTATTIPVAVTGGLTFTSISAGEGHTCAVATGGAPYCWGDNYYGQLGNGKATLYSTAPAAVSGGLTFSMTSAADATNGYACGLTTAGAGYCWGYDFVGQLGLGNTTGLDRTVPNPVTGGLTFAMISVGGTDGGLGVTCGVTATGTAYCWGADNVGQLGNGTLESGSNVPVPVVIQ